MADTHFSSLIRIRRVVDETLGVRPSEPVTGDFYFDSRNNRWAVYDTNQWLYAAVSTTTSTSTSTTTSTTTTL